MFFRRRMMQNATVARHMQGFFNNLGKANGVDPKVVAEQYGSYLWDTRRAALANDNSLSRSRYCVGLCTDGDWHEFERLTKRAALVSDTLLLSHERASDFHILGTQPSLNRLVEIEGSDNVTKEFGFHCPDLTGLGRWIQSAQPLLEAGLVWYLPSYSFSIPGLRLGSDSETEQLEQVKAIDYLVRDGRAIDGTGAEPIKGRLIRPVLQTELPFIEGVGLKDFSAITVQEFGAYSAFRDFLRQSYLGIDGAMTAVETDCELAKIGLQINDQVRAMRAEFSKVRRKRAVTATGAAIGTVGAILTAVYGPAFAAAFAAIGASGGLWGAISAVSDNSTRTIRDDKWYYVWILSRHSESAVL